MKQKVLFIGHCRNKEYGQFRWFFIRNMIESQSKGGIRFYMKLTGGTK